METYSGKSVYAGVAAGRLYVYREMARQVKRQHIEDIQKETARFHAARQAAVTQLECLYEEAMETAGETIAAIFDDHRMMLQDNAYIEPTEKRICSQQVNAEYAVAVTGEEFAGLFERMEDDYLKARAADIRDVTERILRILSDRESDGLKTDVPVIIVADDLTPSETLQMDRSKVLAFVTVHGSAYSHTAILAGAMGIPALVGTPVPLEDLPSGMMAIVDGDAGKLYVEPDAETLTKMQEKAEAWQRKKQLLRTLKGKESVTPDGRKIMLYANIGNEKDLPLALENDAEGIGLFRSEFLFLERDDWPSEEEQMRVYRNAAEQMAGKRVIIRTLDVGADKQADYFGMPREENPAMGCRAVRFCLTRPEIFRTQLRALLRASFYGKIAVMYPMITSLSEIRQIRQIVETVKEELKQEGAAFGNPEQGIMIETPAAVMISDQLAKEVDFFSIGTNDLTQYALALDRQNDQLSEFYDAHHPAVLRMIALTVQNAHKENIRCGICGELGADPQLSRFFLSVGVDELSMSPGSILPIRKIIRETNMTQERGRIQEMAGFDNFPAGVL